MTKRLTVAGIVLAAALALGSPALAATTTTTDYVRDYGTGAGQFAPLYGSAGLMSADYVTVKDKVDSAGNRFYDAISFDNSATVDSVKLTLNISGGLDNWFEDWRVYGSTNGGTSQADRLQLGSALSNGTNWIVTLLAGSGSIFTQAITSGVFGFWFGDEGFTTNSFKLDSAILSVTRTTATPTAAVPLPAGVLLLGSGLGALGLVGWRKKRSAGAPVAA